MFLNTCPFCEHGNPADSKFCNACGGALHLVPCARCGAVNDVTATACYQCHGQLRGRGTDALDPAQPSADVSMPLPRPHYRVIVGTAVFAAIAVLGYYSYHQRSLVDAPETPAASSEASVRGGPADAGVIRRNAAAGDTTPAKADDSVQPATPLAGPTPAVGNKARSGREPVESRKAKAAAAPIAPTKASNEVRVGERRPSRPEVCTEAVAALGLCTMKPGQKKEAEAAAAIRAAIVRPEATDAAKAGQREPPRQEACTEAIAALGLCTPTSTQRRE
jgi:hypothetical protein